MGLRGAIGWVLGVRLEGKGGREGGPGVGCEGGGRWEVQVRQSRVSH